MANIALDKTDINAIADEVLRRMAGLPEQENDPMTDPTNWVRAKDLSKHISLAKSTLNGYVSRGKIGKAKLNGCVYYYLPDIGRLLKESYYKADVIEGIMTAVRGERRQA